MHRQINKLSNYYSVSSEFTFDIRAFPYHVETGPQVRDTKAIFARGGPDSGKQIISI